MAELIARRRFLGFVALAPAIVRASSLMGIRPLIEREIVVVYPNWAKIDPPSASVKSEILKILYTSPKTFVVVNDWRDFDD